MIFVFFYRYSVVEQFSKEKVTSQNTNIRFRTGIRSQLIEPH